MPILPASCYVLEGDEPSARYSQSQIEFVPNDEFSGNTRITRHFIIKQIGVGTYMESVFSLPRTSA